MVKKNWQLKGSKELRCGVFFDDTNIGQQADRCARQLQDEAKSVTNIP
jgi:hypothetical protein